MRKLYLLIVVFVLLLTCITSYTSAMYISSTTSNPSRVEVAKFDVELIRESDNTTIDIDRNTEGMECYSFNINNKSEISVNASFVVNLNQKITDGVDLNVYDISDNKALYSMSGNGLEYTFDLGVLKISDSKKFKLCFENNGNEIKRNQKLEISAKAVLVQKN